MRVLLIDDHSLFRQGLTFLLADLDDSLEFIEASTVGQGIEDAAGGEVDLVLLDYHLPGIEALDGLQTVRNQFESAVVVMLSSEDDPHIIREAIDHGAAGFIPKSSTPEVLVAALKLIIAGGIYIPRSAVRTTPATGPDGDSAVARLSNRQREVLKLVIQGKANKVVARELGISEGTVKAHLSAAFRALNVKNRTEAVFKAAHLRLDLRTNA